MLLTVLEAAGPGDSSAKNSSIQNIVANDFISHFFPSTVHSRANGLFQIRRLKVYLPCELHNVMHFCTHTNIRTNYATWTLVLEVLLYGLETNKLP